MLLLGGERGTIATLIYILLGAVGVPVFAGFSGGVGILFGSTGGYIFGFLFTGLIYILFMRLFRENNFNPRVSVASKFLGYPVHI